VDALRAAPSGLRCVLVGALSHWITVVRRLWIGWHEWLRVTSVQTRSRVTRVPRQVANKPPGAGAVEVVLLDSNNAPVLGKSDDQLRALAAARSASRLGDPWPAWREELCRLSCAALGLGRIVVSETEAPKC
jgi:hypothetical protein